MASYIFLSWWVRFLRLLKFSAGLFVVLLPVLIEVDSCSFQPPLRSRFSAFACNLFSFCFRIFVGLVLHRTRTEVAVFGDLASFQSESFLLLHWKVLQSKFPTKFSNGSRC